MTVDEPELAQAITSAVPSDSDLPAVAPPRIGFHNGLAVRVALVGGLLAFAGSLVSGQLALPQQMAFLWLMAGGFFAVFLYKKRTGQPLTIASGAHLGWICGIFSFVVVTMALAATAVMLTDPAVVASMREQFHAKGIPDNMTDQLIEMFRTPSGLGAALVTAFVLFTILPAVGGAMGAKLLNRD